jgi:hypothetical protein
MLIWGNDSIFQRLFLRVINVIYLLIIPCTSVWSQLYRSDFNIHIHTSSVNLDMFLMFSAWFFHYVEI